MPHLSLPATRHDPFWDMDGKGARRTRIRRKVMKAAVYLIVFLTVILVGTRLPAVDPGYLLTGDGRPILAAALLTLLGSTILIGLSWIRRAQH